MQNQNLGDSGKNLSKCTNGGSCNDGINEFACVCPNGYLKIFYKDSPKVIEIPFSDNGTILLTYVKAIEPNIFALNLTKGYEVERLFIPTNGRFEEPPEKWNNFKVYAVFDNLASNQSMSTLLLNESSTAAAQDIFNNGFCSERQVLQLDPSTELTFNSNNGTFGKAAFTEVITSKLRLTNPSDEIVYYKIKTTAPKVYCVRPNSGILKPDASAEINVLFQPVVDPFILEREGAKHRFMIQSAIAPNDITPIDEYFKSLTVADIMETKLRVAFIY